MFDSYLPSPNSPRLPLLLLSHPDRVHAAPRHLRMNVRMSMRNLMRMHVHPPTIKVSGPAGRGRRSCAWMRPVL